MDCDERADTVRELQEAFNRADDVSPDPDQPLHVLLSDLALLPGWEPSPARALLRFTDWPGTRPDFWIDIAVLNRESAPPRSSSEQYVLGEPWRQFSFSFPWPIEPCTATHAVQMWLNRFTEQT